MSYLSRTDGRTDPNFKNIFHKLYNLLICKTNEALKLSGYLLGIQGLNYAKIYNLPDILSQVLIKITHYLFS